MSATITWKPKAGGIAISVSSPSEFVKVMEKGFGYDAPWNLAQTDIDKLEGMQAAWSGNDDPFGALLDALNENSDEIVVEVSY